MIFMTRTYFISRLSSTEILVRQLSLICYFESFCIYQGVSEFRMPLKTMNLIVILYDVSNPSMPTIENCLQNMKKVLTY
jgi:hypothetical protein